MKNAPHSKSNDNSDNIFHIEDEQVDLKSFSFESWIALFFFWVLGITVFYQFYTRYVLNDSAGWTEEIARYLLIASVFIGMAIGVSKHNHIRVDFIFHFIPRKFGRVISLAIDIFNMCFYFACVFLTYQLMQKLGNYQMTIIDLPMNIVYGICFAGFIFCALRSVLTLIQHWKSDYFGVDEH